MKKPEAMVSTGLAYHKTRNALTVIGHRIRIAEGLLSGALLKNDLRLQVNRFKYFYCIVRAVARGRVDQDEMDIAILPDKRNRFAG